jgi:hypothetical protein
MRAFSNKIRSVFAPVPALAFKASQYDDCKNFLAKRSAETEIVPIVDENQLILSADGTVAETGYRFNAIGFAALSNALVSGLNATFNELTGESGRRIDNFTRADIAAAVNIYNIVLRSRFDALRERTLLLNHNDKTIEGFLGLDHRIVDNAVFFGLVDEEVREKQPDAQFYRAEIVGREVRLYYLDPTTRRNDIYIDARHTFASGWCFSNREDSGVALRALPCLMTKFGPAIDGGKTTGGHMRHTGADVVGRATMVIGKAAAQSLDMDVVAKNVSRLMASSLNFTDSKSVIDAATKNWVSFLGRFRVAKEVARQICKNAAAVGADIDPRNPLDAYSKQVLQSRTLYDMFCSILRTSRQQYHTTRDALQISAMRLLVPSK